MKFERHDIFTGLFVLVGTVFGLSVLLFIAGYNLLDDRTEYWVRFEKLAGVKKGTAIKIKNFTIGEVKDVLPIYGSDLQFKARVLINKEFKIYQGTKVNITNQNVIGDAVLDILPSLSKKYVLKRDDTLFATNIVNLEQMVTQISNLVGTINRLVETFATLAGDNKNDVKMLLTNLNGSIAKVNGLLDSSQGEIVAIMRNIRSTSGTLDKFTKELAENPWKVLDKRPSSGPPADSAALP
ncbi:MlaD family protein [Turneriella parva]|uniref:Mammalian cell entry related domain protein n=1 Tax=Turneriella parva (strain ATCC BAA-1111 / DSM 21527 / NCTC 11395 / H) TaxID=869212 RepID=I4B845_TURPD|nr:MlaD family protein [Turneriella parva]AFM13452.1 Mammalian cell entry related domain protein [Turneriella parva DSM 21527]